MTNNNLSKSFILNNPLLHISRDLKRPLDFNFFRTTLPHQDLDLVCKITLDQIAGNGRLLSMDDISANTGLNINLLFYLRLETAFFTTRTYWGGEIG